MKFRLVRIGVGRLGIQTCSCLTLLSLLIDYDLESFSKIKTYPDHVFSLASLLKKKFRFRLDVCAFSCLLPGNPTPRPMLLWLLGSSLKHTDQPAMAVRRLLLELSSKDQLDSADGCAPGSASPPLILLFCCQNHAPIHRVSNPEPIQSCPAPRWTLSSSIIKIMGRGVFHSIQLPMLKRNHGPVDALRYFGKQKQGGRLHMLLFRGPSRQIGQGREGVYKLFFRYFLSSSLHYNVFCKTPKMNWGPFMFCAVLLCSKINVPHLQCLRFSLFFSQSTKVARL
jgi:hypothetical protein